MSITIENLNKQFGTYKALDNINLEVNSGELLALLGPSGCGKTSLLRIIGGMELADSGKLLFHGEDVQQRDARERNVGFVFQHYALFRHMTVFENVAFGLRVKPRKFRPNEAEIRKRVTRLLDLVQLGWLADRFPSQLSGGQRQRIALARALAVEPKVLLLDEPFGALDAKVRKELRRWLRQLHDEIHVTSVFVTHDQEEALEVSDRVVLMNKGKVEQIGAPDVVYDHPATPFVASFLGSVNLFHGRVENGHLHVGEHALAVGSEHDATDSAIGFVRPHEFDLLPANAPGTGLPARILRVIAIGPLAQVELTRQNGELLEVSVLRDTLAALGLREGDDVSVRPRHIRVFQNNEKIAA